MSYKSWISELQDQYSTVGPKDIEYMYIFFVLKILILSRFYLGLSETPFHRILPIFCCTEYL